LVDEAVDRTGTDINSSVSFDFCILIDPF
jgi:hypothetical protein